ncbi:MAG: type I-C CRISPR-associated protein Cas8c/Csd1 [Gammaproteobacteria bacterium]|nr:type I-C CRISPR-associated protein Cas8c/Csd1 [Gammaproteobacteria bacterium]
MNWLSKLSETYDRSLALDIPDQDKPTPINHIPQNAHINIVIGGNGDFLRAKVLEKTQIILPATERAAGRSGKNPPPYALADKLQYVASDYAEYVEGDKPYHGDYVKQLEQWCDSDFSHPSVEAVLKYVRKNSVISDLVGEKVVWTGDDNRLLTKWPQDGDEPSLFKVLPKKEGSTNQGGALVCWSVEFPGDPNSDTWLDSDVQKSWIDYENSKQTLSGVCYVSGDEQPIMLNHPKKLRHTGDNAKIISSNDWTGFTFRGRFTDTKASSKESGLQGVSIGSLTSQKAHNVLRWLINRQAFKNGDQAIVAWAVSGKEIPEPLVETTKFDLDDFSEVEEAQTADSVTAEIDHTIDIGQSFARKLRKYMAGYSANLSPTDTISIMAIDSATPGRMGVTYYREYLPQEYLDQITRWHTEFAWFQRVSKEIPQQGGKPKTVGIWTPCAPSPSTIINSAYGDIVSKGNESIKKNLFERLVPSVIDGLPVPGDFVKVALNQARNPAGKKMWEWEKCLGVACSLYRGFHIRHPQIANRRKFPMSLNRANASRDYLYGRLLAIAERIEEVALRAARVERPTTASRLMQRFSDKPFTTWPTIYKQLDPYMRQLKTSRPGFLTNMEKELDEVMDIFDATEFKSEKSLSGEFLLGFHAERLFLKSKNKARSQDVTDSHEE